MNSLNTVPVPSDVTQDAAALSANKVIRNTYMLLAMTLAFAAATAGAAVALGLPYPGFVITLVGYFGLLFATSKLRNSDFIVCLSILSSAVCGSNGGIVSSNSSIITS